ncbi:MAG: hypothetical protein EBU32_02245 [Opitutaceae bacterium]|nr:hypothetical protein [Opitutaceae bacterium]
MKTLTRLLPTMVFATLATVAVAKPNVVIIMPDDVSFGDYSTWNAAGPRTPNVDALGKQSVSLTDFHVAPTCSPSRAQLMTGRYTNATGAWHTIKGREFLRADEITMAQLFAENGYRTGIVGKWHLGDAYPLRPEDRGFAYTALIRGGGADQQPAYWGNLNLAPSTYFVNGKPVALTDEDDGIPGAFSTNFFTNRAIEFMRDSVKQATPFFLYVAYNVAHGPQDMPPDARTGISPHTATVENLDKNVGRLLEYLRQAHLADNTVLVFILGDNGMANGLLRGNKGNEYEAGHRVPFFIRWKDGGLAGGTDSAREVALLASEIDLLPTLKELVGLHDVAHRPDQVPVHGQSLKAALLQQSRTVVLPLPDRVLVVDNQREDQLVKYKQACVMRDETNGAGQIVHKWRLIKPSSEKPWELYDILTDVKEARDVSKSADHAALITELKQGYEKWWKEVSARGSEYVRVVLGSDVEPRICLYAHDWHSDNGDLATPWNQGMVAAGRPLNGYNAVQFSRSGTWRFELRRWPEEIAGETSLDSALSRPIIHSGGQTDQPTLGTALPIRSARIKIWNEATIYADVKQSVDPKEDYAQFTIPGLPAGPAMIQTWFYGPAGEDLGGALYDYVEALVHP